MKGKAPVEGRPLEDVELARRAREGDDAAYGDLVKRYGQIAFRVAWLVTRDRMITAKSNIGADDLRKKVTAYLEALRARAQLEQLNRQASDLYQLVIAPIGGRLDRNLTLCVAPDGALQDLPFAALVSPESKRYLVEDFTLVVNPSASVFARAIDLSLRKQKSEPEPFLGFGNPRFDQQRFPKLQALPASEQELERIQSLYPHRLTLHRRQATEPQGAPRDRR